MIPDYEQYERDVDVDGIRPMEAPNLITRLKVRIARFAYAQPNAGLPVNWPFQLSMANIHHLETEPYVVSPKPFGMRYLLYIDTEGKMFLQNNSRRSPIPTMFQLDQDRSPQLIPFDTILDGFLSRKILRDGADDENNRDWCNGKRTFVIMDAIRCNGVDLTQKIILERIGVIEREIMKPRSDGIKKGTIPFDLEVFGLDIAEYVDTALFEENYLTEECKDSYDYLLRSFFFHPRNKDYVSGNGEWIFQWEEDPIRELKEFSFRLRIPDEMGSAITGDLCVSEGSTRKEVKYATIELTDALRDLDGSIIECYYVDHHWVFSRKRDNCNNKDRLPIRVERTSRHLSIEEKLTALENPVTREILLDRLG